MSDLAPALRRLYERVPRGALLGLDRVHAASERLGGVHRLGRYVHVAGTNGKGSTAAFVATMAARAGLRVGLYTSPHLCRLAERVQIDGAPISDDALADALTRVMSLPDDLTFFEVVTLAALVAFREAAIDLAVLEVGLGGRLDATNVAEGEALTAITRVAFDHTDRLGDSLAAIAGEKAGILRSGRPVIVGRLHPDARAVVDARAAALSAPVIEANGEREALLVESYPPSLGGAFQRQNALVAAAVGRELGLPREALAAGLQTTRWPGRCELLETAEGYVLFDCAHNPDGALALKNAMLGLSSSFTRAQIGLVFGAMADKGWRAMLDRLTQVTGPRVYVEPAGRQAVPVTELAAYLDGAKAKSVPEALISMRQRVGRNGVVVVTGSIFLVGAARAFLLGLPCDPPVAL
ncbi:MAG: bifunctional folylpolyglutamate synthase/dihydrofolate synthase [Polyangiaceae bacterium]|nr:bifunctional folylpolyglutamate synthase/dihydrofolate synthase [Polyangiaceae bacterium]